jgi:alpha-N-arabinofuranosidase
MAVNLGTGTPLEAQNLLEYCNLETDTYYANMRRSNGFDKPFGIKTWCLGNEMDGPWQTGQKTAHEYGRIAAECAKMMKWTDPSVELVACGSSNYDMPTFGDWELTVLDYTYDFVDYISLHQYYGNANDNTGDFLGRSEHMDAFIKSVAAMCDAVKAKKHSKKTVNLSFDEWNVWFHSHGTKVDDWQIAPPIVEDIYTFEDALLVGAMLITLQNNCDRVKIACLAQLVNVIAPIMTETGGRAWAQTIYYPYMYASLYGRGTALQNRVDCESYETSDGITVPYVTTSAVYNEQKDEVVVFAVNRSLDEDVSLDFDLCGFDGFTLKKHIEIYSDNLKEINTADSQPIKPNERNIECTLTLKKHSWNMLIYKR